MSRSDLVYIKDILESINLIFSYTGHKTESEFIADNMLQDAVVRRFEIIGEAASKLSESLKQQTPQIQWRLMKAMRNKLIHEYFGVSAMTIYRTLQTDLPPLKEELKKLLDSIS